MGIDDSLRQEVARRARDKRRRQSLFTATEPCDWRPRQVLHPAAGVPFTDAGAWNFIADLLESGQEVKTKRLDRPAGQIGYVMVVKGHRECPEIYIKVTLSRNMINGRSFHDSEFDI